nr:TrbC/VirB2 family protein [candidate division Zixibacteria bacterium]
MSKILLIVLLFGLSMCAMAMIVPPDDADLNNPDWRSNCYNCYNYAVNSAWRDFAQPGSLSDLEGCDKIANGAHDDNLVRVVWNEGDPEPTCPEGWHLVAFAYDSDASCGIKDFHWYRKNGDGTWSQKHGGLPATDRGDDGSRPFDPRNAPARGDYDTFCGYFCVRPEGPTFRQFNPCVNEDEVKITRLMYSGISGPFTLLNTQGEIDELASHLPTMVSVAPPAWWDSVNPVGYGVMAGESVIGLPPQMVVYNGVVAYFADMSDPAIDFYQDDRELEVYLARRFMPVPLLSNWAILVLTIILIGVAMFLMRKRILRKMTAATIIIFTVAVFGGSVLADQKAVTADVNKSICIKKNTQIQITVNFYKIESGTLTLIEPPSPVVVTYTNASDEDLVQPVNVNAPAGANYSTQSQKRLQKGRAVGGLFQLATLADPDLIYLNSWVIENVPEGSPFSCPMFEADVNGDSQIDDKDTLYVGVILSDYTGWADPDCGCDCGEFGALGGFVTELPGYIFSTTPLTIDSGLGFVSDSPFTGDVNVIAIDDYGLAKRVPALTNWGVVSLIVILLLSVLYMYYRRFARESK